MASYTKNRSVILGVFILIGIIILMVGILAIGNLRSTFTKKVEVSAIFDDVNGLLIGANIWFSGVKVGTVKSMEFHGESQVKVTLSVNTESQPFIHHDSRVKIGSDGLIGSKIVVIYGGTPGSRAIQAADVLRVEKALSTDDVIKMLQQNNENILAITSNLKVVTKQLADGTGTVGKLLKEDDLYGSIDATLASVQRTTGKAEKMAAELVTYSQKLNSGDGLANTIATDTTVFAQIGEVAEELKRISATAAAITADLKNVTSQLNASTSPAGVLLNDPQTAADLKTTVKNLELSSEKLDENMEALQSNFLFRRYFKKKAKAEGQ